MIENPDIAHEIALIGNNDRQIAAGLRMARRLVELYPEAGHKIEEHIPPSRDWTEEEESVYLKDIVFRLTDDPAFYEKRAALKETIAEAVSLHPPSEDFITEYNVSNGHFNGFSTLDKVRALAEYYTTFNNKTSAYTELERTISSLEQAPNSAGLLEILAELSEDQDLSSDLIPKNDTEAKILSVLREKLLSLSEILVSNTTGIDLQAELLAITQESHSSLTTQMDQAKLIYCAIVSGEAEHYRSQKPQPK